MLAVHPQFLFSRQIADLLLDEQAQVIRCRNGFIYVRPAAGGYLITATGERSQRIRSEDRSHVLFELVRRLGGLLRN